MIIYFEFYHQKYRLCKYADKIGISTIPMHLVDNDPSIQYMYYENSQKNFIFVSYLFKNNKASVQNLMKMNKS